MAMDRPWWRRRPVTLSLLAVLVVAAATGLGVFFAQQAAQAAAETELLSDGIDRSRLPHEQAVALARLAQSRSADIGDMGHDHHEHGDAHHAHLTDEQRAALDAQLAEAAKAVSRLDTPEKAAAAGYVQASGETDGVGKHWVKWSLVDRPFDPAAPSMLLFDELYWGHGEQLIALSYWVASAELPDGFAGDADQWHRHLGTCFDNGWIKLENARPEDCAGDWINGVDLWMLHAWVVPGVENAGGVFAKVNRKLCERACGLEN